MATPSRPTPAADERRETPRIALARLASRVAIEQPYVTGLDGGPGGRRSTFAGTERLPGVVVIADHEAAGREMYDVSLYLTASPTDLLALAQAIEGSVRDAVDREAPEASVSSVHITFTDLTLPDPESGT